MRVLFVQTEWFEHLGVLTLAAAVRAAGHEVSLLIGRDPRRLLPPILHASPHVVALSAATGGHRRALAIARALRPYFEGKIVMGGPHPTFFPEVISEPALDAICRGEGEIAFGEYLARLAAAGEGEDVPGFWCKREGEVIRNPPAPLVQDLDALPYPARDLLSAAPFLLGTSMRRVLTSRGCPYQCTYCFNHALREMTAGTGPYLRFRSVEHVLGELRLLRQLGAKTLNFVDDCFGLRRQWTYELLERYRIEIGLPFIVNLRPEQADAEMTAALARAGCYCVQMGVESGRENLRRELLGRDLPDGLLREAARRIKAAGLKLLTYNMVALPGETLAEAAATLEWNATEKVDFPRISIFQPYPRTLLGDRVLKDFLDASSPEKTAPLVEAVSESYFRRSPLPGREYRRIENLHKLFHLFIRFPRLRPPLLALTNLPPNPLFDLIFLLSIGLQYRRATNRSLTETLCLGFQNLRAYFS